MAEKYIVIPSGPRADNGQALSYDIYEDFEGRGSMRPLCTFWNVPGQQGQHAKSEAARVARLLNSVSA